MSVGSLMTIWMGWWLWVCDLIVWKKMNWKQVRRIRKLWGVKVVVWWLFCVLVWMNFWLICLWLVFFVGCWWLWLCWCWWCLCDVCVCCLLCISSLWKMVWVFGVFVFCWRDSLQFVVLFEFVLCFVCEVNDEIRSCDFTSIVIFFQRVVLFVQTPNAPFVFGLKHHLSRFKILCSTLG